MAPDPILLIGTVLLLIAGAAALFTGFTAPRGRRGLTCSGGALLVAAAVLSLTLALASAPIYETVSGLNGGRTAFIVLNVLNRIDDLLWAVGLLLVALAATKRLSAPRATPGPPVPSGPHGPYGHRAHGHQAPYAQQGPHGAPRPGPRQGGPQYPGPRPPQQQGPLPSPGAAPRPPQQPGPRPPHGSDPQQPGPRPPHGSGPQPPHGPSSR
ncbi:hypothetical protein [Nocardiopsis ganjiahuensis]|uniref:hypothetical protein n=1 Tax=Nocardiopsis ganjiahuensis TaxID=239984 RepID=UPI000349960B|nr:hypothetical protein [Nocardiopsis ganjiahuensis]